MGSPETEAEEIVTTALTLRLLRFDLKYANGAMPHAQLTSSLQFIGNWVSK